MPHVNRDALLSASRLDGPALPLPASPEAADTQWLSSALSRGGCAVSVRRVQREDVVHGAATKIRVRLDYDTNPGLPEVLWIKSGWEPHSEAMEHIGAYAREAYFYRTLADDVGIRVPTCFYADWNSHGQSVVILEDLTQRGATLWSCLEPRTVEDVSRCCETLANLHAHWWQNESVLSRPPLDIPMRSQGPLATWPRMNGASRLREMLDGPRGAGLPSHIKNGDRIERAFWRMTAALEAGGSECLLHGDPHPGNCFSDVDGGVGLYDWQTAARGPWAFDLAYMITTALSPEDRRACEKELLVRYLDRLQYHGVAAVPSREAAWDEYRRHIAYPLLIWPTNHVSHQSEENIRAMTFRLGTAADDFGFFELWGV
jgi:hypothetical protein